MTPASLATVALARERTEDATRRVAAGRAEWVPLSTLGAMRADWTDLAKRALEPNVFYDPAFALAAAPVFGGGVGAVLVWSKADRLIGFFPARVERRYGVMTTLTGWTHPYAPFGAPLVDRDEAEAAVTAFLDHVEADARLPKLVMLPLIAREGPFAASLARVLLRHGGAMEQFGTHQRALLAPGDDRTAYLEHAVAHKKLKELRRQRRRLEEKGALAFVSADEPAAIAPALADYLMLEAAGWKGRAGTAARQHADVLVFLQSAIAALAAEGRVRVERLAQDDAPLAAAITLRAGETAWFWKIAYDEAFARASPGVQLSLHLTGQLLADETLTRVDSCATADHPMIDHLWRERLALADLLIAPSSAALTQFRLARHLEALRRAMILSAKLLRDSARRNHA